MTAKELQEKCMALQRECDNKQAQVRKLYAMEHCPIEYGDIVTDHYHTIKVEQMSVYGYPLPHMKYTGIELTKQGEPKKRQPVPPNPVFQSNIISINGKPYKYVEEEI